MSNATLRHPRAQRGNPEPQTNMDFRVALLVAKTIQRNVMMLYIVSLEFRNWRHAHDGHYGAATGRDIYILAVTHLRTINGQIAEEWTIFDELALRRQMASGL